MAELAARPVEYDDVDDTYCRLHDDVWLVKVACGRPADYRYEYCTEYVYTARPRA